MQFMRMQQQEEAGEEEKKEEVDLASMPRAFFKKLPGAFLVFIGGEFRRNS